MEPVDRKRHIPALDGVRALAILAVLCAHGTYGHIRGGFIGVEMFFVLSGYLITTVLVSELDSAGSGSVSLRSFYTRRVCRLLPALLLLIIGVWALYLVDGHIVAFGPAFLSTVFVVVYVGNWVVAEGGKLYLLNHTWSLAIEEQFYLIWPLALLLMSRRGFRRTSIVTITLVIVVFSTGLRAGLWLEGAGQNIYYRTDTRAAGLMLGCALALTMTVPPWRTRLDWAVGFFPAAISLAVLGAALLLLDQATSPSYLGGLSAVSLASAILVGHAIVHQSAVTTALAFRPLVWIGRRSYGIYLFHYPIFVYLTSARLRSGHVVEEFTRITLTFGLAAISYRFVEEPILARRGRRQRGAHYQRQSVKGRSTPVSAQASSVATSDETVPD